MTSSDIQVSKSLPSIPDTSHAHGLCIESDSIITTLICQAIAEEGLESRWFELIKIALDDFGRYIESRKGLYCGVRSSRKIARSEQSSARADSGRSRHQSQQDTATKEKAADGYLTAIELENRKHVSSAESKLKQIRDRILTQTSPETPLPMHLLVAVSRPAVVAAENYYGANTSTGPHCNSPAILFDGDVFHFTGEDYEESDSGVIIYGLNSWQCDQSHPPYIAGGTFVFKNMNMSESERLFESLLSILRLSLYVYLSLTLEESLLQDFHVTLQYSPPKPASPRSPAGVPAELAPISEELTPTFQNHKAIHNKSSGSIWSYISRKTESIIHRVSGSSHTHTHTNEDRVDNEFNTTFVDPNDVNSSNPNEHQISDHDTRPHQGIHPYRADLSGTSDSLEREQVGAFTASVRRLHDSACILSTSLQVRFSPPLLLSQLASREEEQKAFSSLGSSISSSISSSTIIPNSSVRLTGVEKVGLTSVVGWETRESRGRGMCGIKGFVRQQSLTVLYRKYLRIGSLDHLCGKPSCITYRYYSQNSDNNADPDPSLGELIESLCDRGLSSKRCPSEGCEGLLQDHVYSWTCDDVIIEGCLDIKEDHFIDADKNITAWQSCLVCKKGTSPKKIEAKTYLFSFAKFLEVLIWSPMIRSLPLCSHVDNNGWKDSDKMHATKIPYNVVYHFSYDGCNLSLSLKPLHAGVYELQFPRLQFMPGSGSKEGKSYTQNKHEKEEKEELGTQIEQWWQGICKRVDSLDNFFEKLTETNKDLPPLPSSDDEGDEDDEEEINKEKFSSALSGPSTTVPPTSTTFSQVSPNNVSSFSSSYIIWNNLKSFGKAVPYPPSLPLRAIDSRARLGELKVSFRRSKESLKAQLHDTPLSSLNDVRQNFKYGAQGISNRLSAWQRKHVPEGSQDLSSGDDIIKDPEWWDNSCHAVPGGRVLVREGEYGSIIAYTLSSLGYQRELANFNTTSGTLSSKQQSDSETQRSLPSTLLKKSTKSPATLPDPDSEDDIVAWSQPETCIISVTRCKHSRDESLLGLRDVLRNMNSSDSSNPNSRFGGSISGGAPALMPPSAWAQPQVQVSLDAADGELTRLSSGVKGTKEKGVNTSSTNTTATTPSPSPQDIIERNGSSGGYFTFKSEAIPLAIPRPVSNHYSSSLGGSTPTEGGSLLKDTLTNAARYLFSSDPRPVSRAPSPTPSSTLHALLAYGSLYSIDEQPHIRYDCTIGDKLKFSCTVYYAKQFDIIRKRCGVDADVINSLQRSETWLAVGGKSKSNFWRSLDGKFVIKTLVNAWNVADLQVLIDLAPSYFRYIESTTTKASTLAKLMGFYTVEVKNLETGAVQTKHDVLIMENLFYNREISRIYDLKGIASRKVKTKGPGDQTKPKTFHDSEWIEAQKHSPLLLRAHSGYILREGLRADAEFLAKSNIMDYSLLLGVDEEKCQIACGLVDTIGSYTFAKTLEYKAKHNLSATKGKEVTVIPPTEYQHRFTTTLESYFQICPDRWTKPQHYIDRTTAHELPEVL